MVGNREVSSEEARQNGVKSVHHQMENGEFRYRLMHSDQTAYIRTEASLDHDLKACWQRSHYHRGVKETYIVQDGRMALVELLKADQVRIRLFEQDDAVMTEPPVPHNVFLYPGADVHTVKHGRSGTRDIWTEEELTRSQDRHPHPLLDAVTIDAGMTPEELQRFNGTTVDLASLRRV